MQQRTFIAAPRIGMANAYSTILCCCQRSRWARSRQITAESAPYINTITATCPAFRADEFANDDAAIVEFRPSYATLFT
jgi:hypothetical protein